MARNRDQNEKMRGERRERIMKEALRQFAQKGLFATKISDIAESADMAQGLMYHYFSSKEEIFTELIKNSLDRMNEAVVMLRNLPNRPHEKIKIAIKEMLKTIDTSDEFNQTCMLIAQATNSQAIPENAKSLIEEKRDFPYTELAKIMAAGIEEGTLINADPDELAVAFWTSLNGLAIYKATRGKNVKMPEAGILAKMFIKGE